MINFTENQLEAIKYIDSDLLISASAGSGKTRVLLEKVLYLIDLGYDIFDILMVTFTNLAANEMKTKLENILTEKFNETGNEKYFEAIKKIGQADICTIDSFCQKLVKKYYYVLNIEPNFNIREENYLTLLMDNALDNTFKFFIEQDDSEFKKLSNLFVYKRDYGGLKKIIIDFYKFLTSKPNKYKFIENLINESYNNNLEENKIINKFINYVNNYLNYFVLKLKEISFSAEQINSIKIKELSDEILNIVKVDIKNFDGLIKNFKEKINFPTIRISNNAIFEEVELKENLQKLKGKIKNFYDKINVILDFDILNLNKNFENSKKLLFKFVEIIKVFEENFLKLKKEENILDFNDIQSLSLNLLNNEDLREEISKKYKFIFVDEYQDTNSIQEELLTKLCKHCFRVMVGDVKQSIYAFRECNPKIFTDKMIRFNSASRGKVINLNENFRSVEPILKFSNNIFSNLMRSENANYSYLNEGMFICGKEDKIPLNLKPIQVIVLDKKGEIEDKNYKENLLVVNAINDLLQKEIIENGVKRNLDYKDIAIISRKKQDKVLELYKVLKSFNIPVSIKMKEQIYNCFEIKLIVSYLKLLDNLNDEISLVSVLKNIYNFSDNDLILIKQNNLCEDIFNYNNIDNIKEKIEYFINDYNYFKFYLGEISVKELIKLIIKQKNLDIKLMKLFGEISLERLKIFIDSIDELNFNLNDFLYIYNKNKNSKFEISKIDGENSVLIDTFHSTKGLEYNAVIIYSAGEKLFPVNDTNIIYNSELGIGIYTFNEEEKLKKRDFIFSLINLLQRQEEFNENVRLSYVALTRPKYYLTIIGIEDCEKLVKEDSFIKFLDFNSYLSLIFSSNFENKFVSVTKIKSDDDIFNPEIVDNGKNYNEQLNFDVFDEFFEKSYKYNGSTNLQLKNSVTSLSEEDEPIYNISNFKITDNDNSDYALIGNMYHYCMQYLPFKLKTEKEIHNKILNLIENKILPNNVFEFIDEEKIKKCLTKINILIENDDKIFREQTFMLNLPYNEIFSKKNLDDKILIQGVIDLLIVKENEIILLDYKTSRLNDYNLIKKYNLQLKLYEKAIKEKYKNKQVKKYIYSFFLDKLINIV